MYKRNLSKVITETSKYFPVLLITGPRQVGKTTILEMCRDNNRNYVTLDDMDARILAQNDPRLFLQRYKPPIIIDEVQYAPELFSYIKINVDQRKENGLYWLTGSQKFHLMTNITESLAGRVAILDLLGLSMREIIGDEESNIFLPNEAWIENSRNKHKSKDVTDIYKQIWLGSFPKIYDSSDKIRDIFYNSYIQTYIQRDVRDILGITNANNFYKFICSVAARTGQLLNYADLARDVAIDNKTAKSWLSILEASGLVYLLNPYFNNTTKRMVKAPKIYFLDTGLCSYLTKWPSPESLESGAMSGAILETFMFTEILKSYWHNGITPYLYYYRDQDQNEIDLIIETGDVLYPVEFKKTATPSINASKHFHLIKKFGKKEGVGTVLCLVDKDIPLSKNVTAIPISYL